MQWENGVSLLVGAILLNAVNTPTLVQGADTKIECADSSSRADSSHCCKNYYTGLPANCANCGCLLRARGSVIQAVNAEEKLLLHTEVKGKKGESESADVEVKARPDVIKRFKQSKSGRGDFFFTSTGNCRDGTLQLECEGFAENEGEFSHAVEDDRTNKRNKDDFAKTHPKNASNATP